MQVRKFQHLSLLWTEAWINFFPFCVHSNNTNLSFLSVECLQTLKVATVAEAKIPTDKIL